MCSITATDNPLLLLSYREIDSTHFFVDISIENIDDVNGFTVPVAFNKENVSICGYDSETGQFYDIEDGIKTKDDYTDIKKGIKLGDFFDNEANWAYTFISNDVYPFVKNNDGIFTFTIFGIESVSFKDETLLATVCFKKLNDKAPDIRIATSQNANAYDKSSPNGALFVNLDGELDVEASYSGDVFNPEFSDASDNSETNGNTDSSKDDKGNTSGSHQEDGKKTDDKKDGSENQSEINASENKQNKSETNGISGDEKAAGFIDLDKSHWAYDMICSLSGKNILNGYDDNSFRPEENITRAEFTKIITAAFKIETSAYKNVFDDCRASDWFSSYVSAAFENKLITGYPDNKFKPNDYISREDLCVILFRALSDKAPIIQNKSSFTDSGEISDYASGAVQALSGLNIIGGYEDNSFRPENNATRAETAKLIYKCIEYMEKN